MSVELVKEQILRFLSTKTPEVLAIKGGWGVGKTYSWEQYTKEFKTECALQSYSYVSLFGINSINELKQETFLNTIDTKSIGEAPNIKGYSKKIADLIKDTKIPYVSKYVGGIGSLINSVSQLAMTNTIICFDDLERHSQGITIKDFMGLVSYLKEQKNCKVVLLLNEDAGDSTFEDYRKYKEKIVDKQLHFEPSAEQCFDIMFTENFELKSYVRDCCIELNIKNKRVIKKIVEQTKELLALVNNFDESIQKQVIHSTIVLCWCYYCHGADEERIPEFSFVNRKGIRDKGENSEWTESKTEKWNMLLNSYRYQFTDEIDLAIGKSIQQGYIDREKLIPFCKVKQKEIEVQKASVKWDEAWKLFHNSFDDNKIEIALAFEEGMRDIAANTSPSQYSSGLKVLRMIDENDRADELIDFFISIRLDDPRAFDPDDAFRFDIKDKVFADKLRKVHLSFNPEPTVADILELRRGSKSYNMTEVKILSELDVDEIYDLFMSFEGEELTSNIRVFILLAGSSKELNDKVNEALAQIANISALNKYRMEKFRV